MSNPNGQPADLKSLARTRRRSNNRHTTFSQRERPSTKYHDFGPWTITPPTGPPVPQNQTVQPPYLGPVNQNSAGAPSTNVFQAPANQPNTPTLPIFTQTQPIKIPGPPTTTPKATPRQNPHQQQNPPLQQKHQPQPQPIHLPQQPPPPKPQLHPSSPTSSITSQNLEDIDLRSPSDDPDYDFIDASEATHSARNAQPDRADKYPELGKCDAKAGDVDGGWEEVKAVEEVKVVEAKKKERGWFGFLQ